MNNKYTDEWVKKEEREILNYFLGMFKKKCSVYNGENGRELLGINICGCIPDGYYSNSKIFTRVYDLIVHGFLQHLKDFLKKYNMSLSLIPWCDDMSDTDYINYEILWDYQNKENNFKRILTKDESIKD